jgi:putative tryptophan/tyrosine transport system substrate-binding protein
MRRRELLALVGGAAAAWPIATRAQQTTVPVIGFLNSASPAEYALPVAGFHQGLGEAGYVDGRNVAIEYRWAEGRYDRLPALAAELVRRQVDIILATGGNSSAQAAKSATRMIPIVFTTGADPVRRGLVSSLNRPGGNVTGVHLLLDELVGKWLELLVELVPKAKRIDMLMNPDGPIGENQSRSAADAARALGVQLRVIRARNEGEIDSAFASLAALRPDALVIGSDPFFQSRRKKIIALAARHAVPAMSFVREFATDGGLASYGASIPDAYRQAGIYAGRILKGAKPADLPVVQPTEFELVINLKTAKALGLTIPTAVLVRADEVIE